MDLVEVDVVGLQTREASLAGGDDVAAAGAAHVGVVVRHRAVELRGEDDAVALAVALERLAGEGFAAAARIDVGGVDEVDATLDGAVDDGAGVVELGTHPEHHRAEAEVADVDAGAA